MDYQIFTFLSSFSWFYLTMLSNLYLTLPVNFYVCLFISYLFPIYDGGLYIIYVYMGVILRLHLKINVSKWKKERIRDEFVKN